MTYADRLNRTLGDDPRVGYVPDRYSHGKRQPVYKWAWLPDLRYRGFVNGEPCDMPMDRRQAWGVVMWQAPGCSLDTWREKYPDLVYDPDGTYFLTDMVLPEGAEPTERITHWLIGSIAEKRDPSFVKCAADLAREMVDRERREVRRQTDDMIDDACLKYDSVPGKRGGSVSWAYNPQ